MNSIIYDAILNRRSVRRYEARPLPAEILTQIKQEIAAINPLNPENKILILLRGTRKGEDLATVVGGYGKILSPPHYLVPTMTGNRFALTDLGYCTQRLVLRLTALGIGTCYVGTVGQEEKIRHQFELPENARVGALVAFGIPAGGVGHVVNQLIRKSVGATNKLPVEKFFFSDSFGQPASPPATLLPLIEAARLAPSAMNLQPWRLLLKQNELFLFVAARYPESKADYRLYDGGICLANLSVALDALGGTGRWQFLSGNELDLPPHPADLLPLARLQFQL